MNTRPRQSIWHTLFEVDCFRDAIWSLPVADICTLTQTNSYIRMGINLEMNFLSKAVKHACPVYVNKIGLVDSIVTLTSCGGSMEDTRIKLVLERDASLGSHALPRASVDRMRSSVIKNTYTLANELSVEEIEKLMQEIYTISIAPNPFVAPLPDLLADASNATSALEQKLAVTTGWAPIREVECLIMAADERLRSAKEDVRQYEKNKQRDHALKETTFLLYDELACILEQKMISQHPPSCDKETLVNTMMCAMRLARWERRGHFSFVCIERLGHALVKHAGGRIKSTRIKKVTWRVGAV